MLRRAPLIADAVFDGDPNPLLMATCLVTDDAAILVACSWVVLLEFSTQILELLGPLGAALKSLWSTILGTLRTQLALALYCNPWKGGQGVLGGFEGNHWKCAKV